MFPVHWFQETFRTLDESISKRRDTFGERQSVGDQCIDWCTGHQTLQFFIGYPGTNGVREPQVVNRGYTTPVDN
jgi:hypothetical protein